ncbi:choline-phosphate cytidylyltransferase [Nematocida minor]|uniref:choline-phosphate cytidylyltransferase n=1 Tax=Nematocida minor TaxID=1912983 RepID=UPI00221EE570|nr:choline-phosphate cytidylyltransferase [Nematocida minor]KAI5189460.1 choline-phosphate cytidylyltransferase [Nematocida minor]
MHGKKDGKELRIYSDGVFDIFHLGHMKMLEQVKKMYPNCTLVAGVCSDEDTHKYKGITVLTMEERAESVRHCRWVDEVIKDAPWIITKEFLGAHNLDLVAHDSIEYSSNGVDDVYKEAKDLGVFVETKRTEGISTSQIITRILKEYEIYLYRNIIRGVSCEELNISQLTKQKIILSESIKEKLGQFRRKIEDIRNKQLKDGLSGMMRVWMQTTLQLRNRLVLFLK